MDKGGLLRSQLHTEHSHNNQNYRFSTCNKCTIRYPKDCKISDANIQCIPDQGVATCSFLDTNQFYHYYHSTTAAEWLNHQAAHTSRLQPRQPHNAILFSITAIVVIIMHYRTVSVPQIAGSGCRDLLLDRILLCPISLVLVRGYYLLIRNYRLKSWKKHENDSKIINVLN